MSNDPVNVLHKRGQGRPAPGELEAGEIGINISSLPTDLDIHGLWDCYIIEPARAFTADEEGVIHAIGDWESLAPSPVYGDVAYQTAYTEAADARLRPGWQQALMNFKNYAAFGGSAGSFPIPVGGDPSDIDVDKYLHNFASIKFQNQHGRYTGENFDVINPPVARLKAEGLLESDQLDKTVTFEIHCLNLTVMTKHDKHNTNNTQFFLPEQTKGKDLSKDGSGTYLTQQLYLNAPESVLSEFELGTHWQIHDDFMERPDEALCVWGGAAFPGGTIRASSSRVPDDPVEGMMYFNTTEKQFVGYDGSEWAAFNGADGGGGEGFLKSVDEIEFDYNTEGPKGDVVSWAFNDTYNNVSSEFKITWGKRYYGPLNNVAEGSWIQSSGYGVGLHASKTDGSKECFYWANPAGYAQVYASTTTQFFTPSIALASQSGGTADGEAAIKLKNNGTSTFEYAIKAADFLDANGNSIIGSTRSVSPTQLIETLSTLRDATRDETTVEGLRDSIGNAIGGLIEKFEATLQ